MESDTPGTTQTPGTTEPPPSAGPRRLTRSRSDRMVAGVCGGIAQYFGIDALLVRIGFVVAVFFGGTGALAYGIAWLAVPEEGRRRALGHKLLRTAGSPPAVGVVLVVVGGIVLLHQITHVGTMATAVTLLAAGVALLLWSPSPTSPGDDPPPPAPGAPPPPPPPPPSDETVPGSPPPAGPRPRRPRSPLGRYVLSAVLVVAGAVGIADAADALDVGARGILAAALLVTGLGLLVGAWWGRARALIALGVVLTVTLGALDWLDLDLTGGWGDRSLAPDALGELDREYRLAGGDLRLDLTDYPFPPGSTTEVRARVTMGHVAVIVPEDVHVVVDAHSKMGHIELFGDDEGGIDVDRTAVQDHPGEPELRLDLEATMGQIEVMAR